MKTVKIKNKKQKPRKERDWIAVMMWDHCKPGAMKNKKKWDRKNKSRNNIDIQEEFEE